MIEAYLCFHFGKFPRAQRDSFPISKNCVSYYGNSAQRSGELSSGMRVICPLIGQTGQLRRLTCGTNTNKCAAHFKKADKVFSRQSLSLCNYITP